MISACDGWWCKVSTNSVRRHPVTTTTNQSPLDGWLIDWDTRSIISRSGENGEIIGEEWVPLLKVKPTESIPFFNDDYGKIGSRRAPRRKRETSWDLIWCFKQIHPAFADSDPSSQSLRAFYSLFSSLFSSCILDGWSSNAKSVRSRLWLNEEKMASRYEWQQGFKNGQMQSPSSLPLFLEEEETDLFGGGGDG